MKLAVSTEVQALIIHSVPNAWHSPKQYFNGMMQRHGPNNRSPQPQHDPREPHGHAYSSRRGHAGRKGILGNPVTSFRACIGEVGQN